MGKLLLIPLLIVLATGLSRAQSTIGPGKSSPASNLREKYLPVHAGLTVIDSSSLIPNTVHIPGIPAHWYTVDWLNGTVYWKQVPPIDSVLVRYRVLGSRLNASRQRLNFDSIANSYASQQELRKAYGDPNADNEFFNFGNITYNGSFGRGISFGNAQDAVVTSNLNLQISGYLADSIEIAAAITDNNIPIQPDGTTQQLNEFDRIFLQFKKNGWALSLGDIDLRQNRNYFLNFYKRLQGASFENTSTIGRNITNSTLFSGSIAKGKFTRNVFDGMEGNQGPYRLTGANDELYFVVLAGTERVFIDGELMQRGEDRDYTINYNTAEITFTPRRMITKDRRIQVEFEYADRNYLNTNLYLANETNFGKRFRLRMGVFSNNDAKNSPINQTLDPQQKQFLSAIGDSVQYAFYPVAQIDTFSPSKILYKKVEIENNGLKDSIYIYSTNPDSARYNLSFVDVGAGKGNYVPDLNAANGKVYKWVAPVNNVPQGQYEAATFLVTPKRQQVLTFGGDYQVDNRTLISADVGMSRYDINTFSTKGKGNDRGLAGRLQLKHVIPISRGRRIQGDGSVEWVEHSFKPLERLRNVEFTRDWGLPLVVQPADETMFSAGLELGDDRNNKLRYQLTGYNRSDGFSGIRNSLTQLQETKGWRFNNQVSMTSSESGTDKGYFFRPTFDISKTLSGLQNYTLGASYSLEQNIARYKQSDTITPYSFSFDVLKVYLNSDDKKPNRWGVSYYTRADQMPAGSKMERTDRSQNISLMTELLKSQAHQLRLNTTYRVLKVDHKTVANTASDKSLLGRMEYAVNEWNGMLSGNVLYELGAGQEQKRDYAFLEVPAGQGEYAWFDYNGDGVQQLNEFEIAQFSDQAKFIRIFTPTNDFVKASYNSFNYSLALNPRNAIELATASGLKKFIARISLQSSLQLSRKQISDGISQFNPFSKNFDDSTLITLANIWVNSLAFNRFSSKWGFDISQSRNRGKILLTYGLESRALDDFTFRTRWNLTRKITFELTGKTNMNELETANAQFDNRNYRIDGKSLEPKLSFTQGANFRVSGGYRYGRKENREGAGEIYLSNAFNTDIKYNILQSTSVQARFTYNTIKYPYATNSTVSYVMLDGLQPGRNLLWTLDLTKRLGRNLEMNIQYEGRKPGDTRIIHIGRAGLRAIL
ncbi:hypothetical protein [Flavihumibacter petaseus]|uniref:PA14 domain-containing protein n=1 Tax=Flavihumibacter petaseus NBRC 106054 TaxID=1220578 RepID=A0A0E9N5E1_9BACT|nr:hypothetical protein [Flavihumibacter petaseus]GAO44560.1 hypothetical protein FPE01S_03_05980 [Flavihumibacter petaseus NBRC 106054]